MNVPYHRLRLWRQTGRVKPLDLRTICTDGKPEIAAKEQRKYKSEEREPVCGAEEGGQPRTRKGFWGQGISTAIE